MSRSGPGRSGKRIFLYAGAVVIILVIALVWMRRPAEEAQGPQRAVVPVQVAEVRAETLRETVRGIGTLRAPAEVVISPETAGRVKSIHFQEGSFVEEGQILVELKDEKLRSQLAARQAAVQSAQTRLDNLRRTFERQERLVQQDLVSEDEFERVRTEFESAEADLDRFQAELELTREELEDMVIRAPFSGAVSEKLVDPGAYVNAGEALARLYQLHPLEMSFDVPGRFASGIRAGQDVAITTEGFPNHTFYGDVTFVSPVIEEDTRTLSVKATVPNLEGRLKPGAFATAVITVGTREDRPVVPEESLVGTREGYMVFVVEDGMARSRTVETGLRRAGLVEITQGLRVGERVVRSGHMRLDDGDRVKVSNPSSTAEGASRNERAGAPR